MELQLTVWCALLAALKVNVGYIYLAVSAGPFRAAWPAADWAQKVFGGTEMS